MKSHLALFSLCVTAPAAVSAQSPPATVPVVLISYRYAPSPLVLKAGKPVVLLFQNRAGKAHDFVAPEFFNAARIVSGDVRRGGIALAAGQSKAVQLVPAAGTYPVHCSKFLHSAFGMKTQVVVR